jgi:hypothetical protein
MSWWSWRERVEKDFGFLGFELNFDRKFLLPHLRIDWASQVVILKKAVAEIVGWLKSGVNYCEAL